MSNLNMMMIRKYALLLTGTITLAAGCKQDDDQPEPGTGAGKGGNATLRVMPRHHSEPIDSMTVFVKYNAVDKPADGRYDDSAKVSVTGGVPIAVFTGLRKGNYYLYGYGWDRTPGYIVKGGYAYPLQNETDQSTELAVSED